MPSLPLTATLLNHWSARTSTEGGIVSPSAFAVLLNLVGCSTSRFPFARTRELRPCNHHDFCRQHATAGDRLALVRAGETATNVWWEMVETEAVPIPGTQRPLSEADRVPGVTDPDDERV